MQFLRTLFWVVVAVVAVIFAIRNWTPVVVHLWGGLEADIKLPVLLLIAFLVGFLPWFLLHKATRWQLKRKLEGVQRALEEERARSGILPAQDPMEAEGVSRPMRPPTAVP
jgi:lipopolysaccharide assembly protein A